MDDVTAVLDELSLRLSRDKAVALTRYAELLRAANARAGLVSTGDLGAIERRHFAESLALLTALEKDGHLRSPAIDIGSGGGFPGLPVKIVRPELRVTLLEPTAKKAAFLESVIAELSLVDVEVVCGRAEDIARQPGHREAYALALARAVAPLRILAEYALPFLAAGGVLAAPKGSAAPRELREAEAAVQMLGGQIESSEPMPIAARGPVPTLIIVRKASATPERYPRRPGIPRKRPL
jgi:16S rRNA (guanine527-N7)-methyltransferase